MEILDQPEPKSSTDTSRSLQDVLENGYEFKFGEYLTRIFKLLKPTWGHLIGNTALVAGFIVVIEIVLMLVVFASVVGFASTNDFVNPSFAPDMAESMMMRIAIAYGTVLLAFLFLIMPLRAGIHVFLRNGTMSGNYSFGDFFEVYKTKWLKMVGLCLMIFLISYIWVLVPYVLFISEMFSVIEAIDENGNTMPSFSFLGYMGLAILGYIPMIYFLVSYSLAIPILLFKTDDVWKALEGSRRIVCRKGVNWFIFFGFYFVLNILAVSGIIACGLGLLLTINSFALGIFTIYEDIFGLGEEKTESSIV